MHFKSFIFCLFVCLPQSSMLFCENPDTFSFYPPIVEVYHPVTTKKTEAQEAFNRGLLAIYAFNYDEAYASFEKATEIDPDLAMAYWGMALSLDETLESTVTSEMAIKTCQLSQKAFLLSENATENEQSYIFALTKRFSEDEKVDRNALRAAYKDAMRRVVTKYPDDLDAATLYAESIMDSLSWDLWNFNGSPREGTMEILKLLESVLKKGPMHIGANHYYVHAVEGSPHPEWALMSATRLDGLLPEWGHLLHTASHIYMRLGSYEKTVEANKRGIIADKEYIKKHGFEGHFGLHDLTHNYFFLCRANLWLERYEDAINCAKDLEDLVYPHLKKMPGMEDNLLTSLQAYLYFHKWNEILQYPEPVAELKLVKTFWHYAQGMAYSALGNVEKAQEKKTLFLKMRDQDLKDNDILKIAEDELNAAIAKAKGNLSESIEHLKKGIEKQDNMNYLSWYHIIRQTLGSLLIEKGSYQEAEGVFREALKRLPRNGRSLFGLLQALKAQDKFHYWIEREEREALKYSKADLKLSDL